MGWRLLVDGPASGDWNMAVDEALLASAIRDGTPSLRFYTWQGPWLSLGYAQPRDPARLAACARAGVGVVRRATGGRAVLHGADLTYALAAPEELLPGGLLASYRRVGEGLARALAELDVAVVAREPAPPAQRPERGPGAAGFDCFAAATAHELCAGGRKLVGSAQRRTRGGVLQHGSIRVGADPEPARRAAGLSAAAATSLAEQGFRGGLEVLVEACARGLAAALAAELEPAALLARERELAARARRAAV